MTMLAEPPTLTAAAPAAPLPESWDIAPDGAPMANLGAEQTVLGLMMANSRHVDDVVDALAGDDFYWPKHGAIWSALMGLRAAKEPTDPVAVGHALHQSDDLARVGGLPYLHTLLARVPTAAGTVGFYATIVHNWAVRRRVEESGLRVVQSARNLAAPIADVVEAAQRTIHEATVTGPATAALAVNEFIDDEFQYLEDVRDGKVAPGVTTGFLDLDAILGGWYPGRLIIPAGRPGMGKSILSLNWAMTCARLGHPVLIFPMEMSKREVMWRIWSAWARLPLHLFQRSTFDERDWDRLRAASAEVRRLPLVVDDQVNTVAQITSTSRRFAQQYGQPGMILADYVQRLKFPGTNRHDIEVGDAAKAFKELGRELQTTFVAVAQINRGNENRTDRLPQLSDLRDSGQLEQEADQVVLIHRPDYYDKECERAGEADLIVAKNRHGPTDTVTVAAQLHFARFVDMAIA